MPETMQKRLTRLGEKALKARESKNEAFAALADAVREACASGMNQSEVARYTGVDRQTVRAWIGK